MSLRWSYVLRRIACRSSREGVSNVVLALALGSAGSVWDILGWWSDEALFGGCVGFMLGMIGGWLDVSHWRLFCAK